MLKLFPRPRRGDDAYPIAHFVIGCTDLGRLSATRDGQPLDLGGPRQRAVLGVLIAARREVIPAGWLIDLVWGEEPPAGGSGALQAYISHLRRRLEPTRVAHAPATVLVSEGSGYALRIADDTVDAWRFEAAVNAASGLGRPTRRQRSRRPAGTPTP